MEWNFKKDAEPQGTSAGFWYDLTEGGYIDPVKVLESIEQAQLLTDAVNTVLSFKQAMEKAELIIEF